MNQFNRVIYYIIEQADKYDSDNLQFEQDIIFQISRLTDKMINDTISSVKVDISSILAISSTMISIERIMNQYVSDLKKIMIGTFNSYYNRAYDNTGDLIQLGNEVSANLNAGVREQKSKNTEYDEDTIAYIQEHSFELLKGYSRSKIEAIRAKLGDMFLRKQVNKANVRKAIEDILDVNKSKAEEIAQTELSRAYNYGSMARLVEYQVLTGTKVMKYWHGFKYSEVTCEYCRPRIGEKFDLDDDTEVLPAHVRCRCVWLPLLDGWDQPVSRTLISRANMINTIYSRDMMYQRINNRLGIDYAGYMSDQAMVDYLAGDRTEKIDKDMYNARNGYISDKIKVFDIAKDTSRAHMADEFNQQMAFWKKYVAGSMADGNKEALNKSYEAIKGVMVLPWNAEQLQKWNQLLDIVGREIR